MWGRGIWIFFLYTYIRDLVKWSTPALLHCDHIRASMVLDTVRWGVLLGQMITHSSSRDVDSRVDKMPSERTLYFLVLSFFLSFFLNRFPFKHIVSHTLSPPSSLSALQMPAGTTEIQRGTVCLSVIEISSFSGSLPPFICFQYGNTIKTQVSLGVSLTQMQEKMQQIHIKPAQVTECLPF